MKLKKIYEFHISVSQGLYTKLKCVVICDILHNTLKHDTRCSLRHIFSSKTTTHSARHMRHIFHWFFWKSIFPIFFNSILFNYFILFYLIIPILKIQAGQILGSVRFASDRFRVVLSGSSWIQIGIFSTKTWSRNSLKKKSNLKIHFSYVQPRCLYIAMCALKSGERIVSTQNEKNSYTTYSKYNTIFCWSAWHNNSRHINTTHLNLVCVLSMAASNVF